MFMLCYCYVVLMLWQYYILLCDRLHTGSGADDPKLTVSEQ